MLWSSATHSTAFTSIQARDHVMLPWGLSHNTRASSNVLKQNHCLLGLVNEECVKICNSNRLMMLSLYLHPHQSSKLEFKGVAMNSMIRLIIIQGSGLLLVLMDRYCSDWLSFIYWISIYIGAMGLTTCVPSCKMQLKHTLCWQQNSCKAIVNSFIIYPHPAACSWHRGISLYITDIQG